MSQRAIVVRCARVLLLSGMLFPGLPACRKSSSTGSPDRTATPGAAPSALAAASSAESNPREPPVVFRGTYTAAVGQVEVPAAAGDKAWLQDPGATAVGAGTVEFAVTPPYGDARGEARGPLGELVVTGRFDGRELRANLMPKDPNGDAAMTGVMLLAADADVASTLRGSLRVSSRDARLVREAKVEVSGRPSQK